MAFELGTELSVERDAHGDAVAIHHLDIAIEQLRIVLALDEEMGVHIDHWKRRSLDARLSDNQTRYPFGSAALSDGFARHQRQRQRQRQRDAGDANQERSIFDSVSEHHRAISSRSDPSPLR